MFEQSVSFVFLQKRQCVRFYSCILAIVFFLISDLEKLAIAVDDIPSFITVERLTIDEGMPSNEVRFVFNDEIGFMWFMTDSGLVKYDSHDLTILQNNPRDADSLSSDEMNCAVNDGKGVFWLGTSKGLNRLDVTTGIAKHFFHNPERSGSLSSDIVWSLCKDRKGRLWIGTDQGLNLWEPQSATFKKYSIELPDQLPLFRHRINKIIEDDEGNLWLGMVSGTSICKFDPETEQFKNIELRTPEDKYPDITCLYYDSRGFL